MSLLTAVLICQFFAIVFIVLILKVALNRMLIDLAIRHFDVWKMPESVNADRILILTHKSLNETYKNQLKRSAGRIFSSSVLLDFQVQKSIWGGIIIRIQDQALDFSLRDRIEQALQMK